MAEKEVPDHNHHHPVNDYANHDEVDLRGYTNEFVDEIPDTLECPICYLPFRDPHLLSCCGVKLCSPCLQFTLNQNKPCPYCREEGYHTMLDKSINRQILSMRVRCKRNEAGCDWIGELIYITKHEDDSCQFKEVECPFECGGKYLKRDMEKHQLDDCPYQPDEWKRKGFETRMMAKIAELEKKHEEICHELKKDLQLKDEEIKSLKLELAKMKDTVEEKHQVLMVHSEGFRQFKPPKLNCETFFTFNGKLIFHNTTRGLNVLVMDDNYNIMHRKTFDTHGSKKESGNFASFIDGLPDGCLIAVALMDEGSRELFYSAKHAIDLLGGGAHIHKLGYRHSYSLVCIKGHPYYTTEVSGAENIASVISFSLPPKKVSDINSKLFLKAVCSNEVAMHAVRDKIFFSVSESLKDKKGIICHAIVDTRVQNVSLQYYDVYNCYLIVEAIEKCNDDKFHMFSLVGNGGVQFFQRLHCMFDSMKSTSHRELCAGKLWVMMYGSKLNAPIEMSMEKAHIAMGIAV
jgi:hypothetical protein